ncbi:hypothetical protein GGGNBK_12310 [Sporosarcina sp. ANT_H38]
MACLFYMTLKAGRIALFIVPAQFVVNMLIWNKGILNEL